MVSASRPPLPHRLPGWVLVAIDAVIAGSMALISVTMDQRAPGYGLPVVAGHVIALASTLPLAVRRCWPVPVFAVLLAGSVLAGLVLRFVPYSGIPLALAGYSAALVVPRGRVLAVALWTTAIAALGAMTAGFFEPSTTGWLMFSAGAVVFDGVLVGEIVRRHRRYAAALREQDTAGAVTQERLRIAREMHDIVAHQMSVIAVQAGVARLVMRSRPEEAFGALVSIEQASRAGLGELRRMLSTLRADGEVGAGGADGEVGRAPTPSLAELDTVTSRAQAAGLAVTVQVHGCATALPAGMELAAYRVIQEALTNVVKHAGAGQATVVLHYRPDALGIDITDDGHGTRTDRSGSGYGLIGMRERIAMYGGQFTAGPVEPPGTGFRVNATLPIAGGAR